MRKVGCYKGYHSVNSRSPYLLVLVSQTENYYDGYNREESQEQGIRKVLLNNTEFFLVSQNYYRA